MLLAEVVAVSDAVAATGARSAKVAALAELLRRLDPAEVGVVVAMLTGEPRQGAVGVGWSTLLAVDPPPAALPSLTVGDVDDTIEALAATSGPGSVEARRRLLVGMLARATSGEASFIRRLLLGELRQGALAGVMADAVAKAAGAPIAVVRRAAMLSGDLGATAELALGAGRPGLEAVGLTVGRAVLPMLAATAGDVAQALAATGPASVEWKLDGARIQAHRAGDEVRLFTRNLNEITARLPSVVAQVAALHVEHVVLDGEVVGYGEEIGRPNTFQQTMSEFARQRGEATATPAPGPSLRVAFFDVLHRDGVDLLDEPLSARLEVLDEVAGRIAVPRLLTDDADAATTFLEEALHAGHEGVMVKALASPYEAGRRGGTWRKVKPVRTLDLVVLAAEWGHGRRRGWLSNLHLGARAAPSGAGSGARAAPSGAESGARAAPSGGFVMVGKTFKGLTDELLRWQTAALLERAVERGPHVVTVRPELVIEIALDGVQRSTRYPGGVALRFARVRRYRPDKTPAEADTIATVQAMLPPP